MPERAISENTISPESSLLGPRVREVIEVLGTERLTPVFITSFESSPERLQAFYVQLQRFVHRLLFLLLAEGRGALFSAPGTSGGMSELRCFAVSDTQEGGAGLRGNLRSVYRRVWDDDGVFPEVWWMADSVLLRVFRTLTQVEGEDGAVPIDFGRVEAETLGFVYEGLLDYEPCLVSEDGDPRLVLVKRERERKATGSYYTQRTLVEALLESTLLPVMRNRLAEAGMPVAPASEHATSGGLLSDYGDLTPDQRALAAEALLNIQVCDPAAGSGHFLLAATDLLAAELARVRTGESCPNEIARRASRRDVLARCIYGVDRDPLAVEICALSLWLGAGIAEAPPPALVRHLRQGNTLVGVIPSLLAEGVPYEAFVLGRTGDDRELAKQVRARNRQERREFERGGGYQTALIPVTSSVEPDRLSKEVAVPPELVADVWTAAFFWPLTPEAPPPPTFGTFLALQTKGQKALTRTQRAMVQSLAEERAFFHWHLAFPEIFHVGPEGELTGGFDVVVGNPPFSADLDPGTHALLKFVFPKAGTTNTAALFMLRGLALLNDRGRLGFVCPKSATYSMKWQHVREILLPCLVRVIDCGEAWDNVLLEEVLITLDRSTEMDSKVDTGVLGFEEVVEVPHALIRCQDVIFTGVEPLFFDLLERQPEWLSLGDLYRTQRGRGWQRLLREVGEIPVYGGRDLARFRLKGISGYVDREVVAGEEAYFRGPKALFQNVVAHVFHPRPHVKLIGTVDYEDRICLDTVNMLTPLIGDLSLEAVVGLLSSRLMNWLVYRLLYNRAVRTMHFDQYFLDKIPVPLDLPKGSEAIAEPVKEILHLTAMVPMETMADNLKIAALMREIDEVVFAAYRVSASEAQTIAGDFPPVDV